DIQHPLVCENVTCVGDARSLCDSFIRVRQRCWKIPGVRPIIGPRSITSNSKSPVRERFEPAMPTVKFLSDKKSIEVPDGANLRKEAMKNGIELYTGPHRYLNCRGNGLCCSCQVRVKKGTENVSKQG